MSKPYTQPGEKGTDTNQEEMPLYRIRLSQTPHSKVCSN